MKLPEIVGKQVKKISFMGTGSLDDNDGILIEFTDGTNLLIGYVDKFGGAVMSYTDWKWLEIV